MDETNVGSGGIGDHPRCRGGERLHSGTARGGLYQLAKQSQLAISFDEIPYGICAFDCVRGYRRRATHW
jgi:hypothetical protein